MRGIVSPYLAGKEPVNAKVVLDKLTTLLKAHKSHPVGVKGLRVLESIEKQYQGETDCIGEFKYASNQEMIELIEKGTA
ncbi:hypothetical protein EMGBD2_00390 [Nitrospirota bacterium]|nr:hypothetical protein EMGBD2_00390 [Nitrospirota bacterium]